MRWTVTYYVRNNKHDEGTLTFYADDFATACQRISVALSLSGISSSYEVIKLEKEK